MNPDSILHFWFTELTPTTTPSWAASPRPRSWCFWVSRGRGF